MSRSMNDWENPGLFGLNRLPARAYLFPYPNREAALTCDRQLALNILLKLMAIVSVVFAPIFL